MPENKATIKPNHHGETIRQLLTKMSPHKQCNEYNLPSIKLVQGDENKFGCYFFFFVHH